MTVDVFRFTFGSDVSLDECEQSLQVAMFAAEGLFGQSQVLTDFGYHRDTDRRTICVDGTSDVGSAIVRMFTGLLIRQFGEGAFSVSRFHRAPECAAT